jgi:phage terminase large subunit GpA-like protein
MPRPGAFLEDWDLLVDHVMLRKYGLGDGSGREMQVKLTVCDSGGEAGATTQAYNFVRRLRYDTDRPELRQLSARFHLLKGNSTPGAPRAYIAFPDSKDKKAAARGDVPVLMLHSNILKDALNNRLLCTDPGKGMLRFPKWLHDRVWTELCEEFRDSKGWQNPNNRRNEAWDLSYYAIGACVSSLLRLEVVDWSDPPDWCRPWAENPLVLESGANRRFEAEDEQMYDFSKLGMALG